MSSLHQTIFEEREKVKLDSGIVKRETVGCSSASRRDMSQSQSRSRIKSFPSQITIHRGKDTDVKSEFVANGKRRSGSKVTHETNDSKFESFVLCYWAFYLLGDGWTGLDRAGDGRQKGTFSFTHWEIKLGLYHDMGMMTIWCWWFGWEK